MKTLLKTTKTLSFWAVLLSMVSLFPSCEKDLKPTIYDSLNDENFFKTPKDALAAVNAMYTGMMPAVWNGGWGASGNSYSTQSLQTTDEGVCNWDDGGMWKRLNRLDFTPDFSTVTQHYQLLIPVISQITSSIPKIEAIQMDENLKKRYVGELKALRAYYMQILYLYYGPVPARLIAQEVDNPNSPVMPRPSKETMVANIVKDFTDAIAVLPDRFNGSDYGRFSKAACYTSLMKLYMQEKRWPDALAAGRKVQEMGFSLIPEYSDLFNYNNKNGNSETILAVVCSPNSERFINIYRPHYLPADYYDAEVGNFGYKWDGYRMPWKTYDKFDPTDYRLKLLLQKYPTLQNGQVILKDARASNQLGAVMAKYGPDPTRTNEQNSGVNYVVMRYADVELLMAEAINEISGPTPEAFGFLNDVRTKHGKLSPYVVGSLNKEQFKSKLQDERLFELWAEGARRDDLIRWGQYIQRAKDDGFTAADYQILFPLPRSIVNQSNGVIKQNPSYQ